MGRTIPSFRIALAMEKKEWKPSRDALDKSDRKKFLIRWCLIFLGFTSLILLPYAVQYVRLDPDLFSLRA
jgi:hypothetical protein